LSGCYCKPLRCRPQPVFVGPLTQLGSLVTATTSGICDNRTHYPRTTAESGLRHVQLGNSVRYQYLLLVSRSCEFDFSRISRNSKLKDEMYRVYWSVGSLVILGGLATFPVIGADTDPSHSKGPLRLIVPAAPGGVLDLNARRISDRLGRELGRPIIVDNRPGASGTIAMNAAARAQPDGNTLVVGALANICIIPRMMTTAKYDPIRDFVPIAMGTRGAPMLLVHADNPSKTVADFVIRAKASGGKFAFGSPGIGSTQHLAMEMFQQQTGTAFIHVPFKDSNAQVLSEVAAGRVTATIDFSSVATTYLQAGRIRALFVASPTRNLMLADVPSNIEAGLPEFNVSGWHGYFAPAGTAPSVLRNLEAGLSTALSSSDYVLWARGLGNEATAAPSGEFALFVRRECEKWQQVIKQTKITVD
jgi:tripartite-type tricarboxylate transporter receptor subunit TctC